MTVADDSSTAPSYDALLAQAPRLYPGVRIGRPGASRTYYPMIAGLRVLRARYHVEVSGDEHVADGPAILIGNHTHAMDPVMVVMSEWWRVSAFAKVEVFQGRGSIFFRIMGQIPLRRGDAESTAWAMQMSTQALDRGGMIGLYPEGTRGPDPTTLFRLHKRVMIPLLESNPEVPVHAVVTRYERRPRRRTRVTVRVSPPLPVDARSMAPDEVTGIVRDALLQLGGLKYVDRYARDVKAELRAARESPGR